MVTNLKHSISGMPINFTGLIALADLSTIAQRTALVGASYFDILFLAPGLHTQQNAVDLNRGDLPTTGAMTSGYVFRIENQAMVYYMQRVGRPGHLVNISVQLAQPHELQSPLSSMLYLIGISLTVSCFAILVQIRDYWAIGVLGMLVLSRTLNTLVFKRRTTPGWKGVKEPNEQGDLLVLLSQDRWIRIRGLVDDIKLVTSGQWARDAETLESYATAFATLLVYSAALFSTNATTIGALLIFALLLVSVALLALCNTLTKELQMFGCRVFTSGEPKSYRRRLDMAKEMIEEHGGLKNWAVGMGLVLPEGEGVKATV